MRILNSLLLATLAIGVFILVVPDAVVGSVPLVRGIRLELGGVLLSIGLLGLAGMLATVEAAVGATRRSRLLQVSEDGSDRASDLRLIQARMGELGAVTRLFLAFAIATASVLLVSVAGADLVSSFGWVGTLFVIVGVVTLVAVLFGDLIPHAAGVANPEPIALALTGTARVCLVIGAPIFVVLRFVARMILRAPVEVGHARGSAPAVSEAGIMRQVNVAKEEGVFEADQGAMIESIFTLNDTIAREIMVHRIDIVGVPTTASVAEAVKRGLDAGHSRIPVYEGTVDQIVGIFYLKDALRLRRIEDTRSVGEMMRPAYFVPETKKVDDILREMQFRRIHLATIVDEYGGTAGLITIEDILEEIVGDIRDEFDIEEPPVQRLSEDIAVVDASVALDDLNEILGLELASDDVDTLGGLIYESLGRVPSVGDVISTPSARLVVEEVDGTRINKVRVVKSVPGSAPTAAPAATDPSTIRPPTGD